MWTMTPDGFLSAVAHREDPSLVMVRARDEESLLRLARNLGRPADEVYSSCVSDYPYRLVVPKSEYAAWLSEQVMAMDYDNFKSAAHERRGGRFTTFLHTVWVAGLALTELPEQKKD